MAKKPQTKQEILSTTIRDIKDAGKNAQEVYIMSIFFMGWKVEEYDWEQQLNNCSDDIIRETGLSREKVEETLKILSQHRIINAKVIN